VEADVREPGSILRNESVRAVLDFDRPMAALMIAVLHFVRDDEARASIAGALTDAVRPGDLTEKPSTSTADGRLKLPGRHGRYRRTPPRPAKQPETTNRPEDLWKILQPAAEAWSLDSRALETRL
jgi:hypothetical protein